LSHSLAGWWFFPTPLKNDGVKGSWEYGTIPNCDCFWKFIKKSMVPVTNQPLDPWNFLGEISTKQKSTGKKTDRKLRHHFAMAIFVLYLQLWLEIPVTSTYNNL